MFRPPHTISHSAVLVPAAALCLGLLSWVRGDVDVRPDGRARFTPASGVSSGAPCLTATDVPVLPSTEPRFGMRDIGLRLPQPETSAARRGVTDSWRRSPCVSR